jgi:hypothetical protein
LHDLEERWDSLLEHYLNIAFLKRKKWNDGG